MPYPPRLSALEAALILTLARSLARATAAYVMQPFSENDDDMKKAEKKLREFVYKLAQGE